MNQAITRAAVARYSELPLKAGYAVKVDDTVVALFKLNDGSVRAIENRSPNQRGGILSEGLVSGAYIFDAIYDWKISLVDGKVQAPDEGQVGIYPVEIEEDIVYILK